MKLTLFGDLHYSYNYKEVDQFEEIREHFFDYFVKFIFEEESDYYISLGDLTNTGLEFEHAGIMQLINQYDSEDKFKLVLGNHDMYSLTKEEVSKHMKHPTYFSIIEENVCLVFLDSAREKDVDNYGGNIDEAQFAWLEETLAKNEDKTIVIFVHHPIYKTTHLSDVKMAFIEQSDRLWELLKQHPNKGYYLNGHKHADSIVEHDNWTFIQVSAVLDQPAKREIYIDDKKFEMKVIEVDKEHEQLGHWLASKMNYFRLVPYGYRGEKNRNLLFSH